MRTAIIMMLALTACMDGSVKGRAQDNIVAAPAPHATSPAPVSLDPHMPSAWTEEQPPAKLFGNSFYVGTKGLSSVLINTGEGLILIDPTIEGATDQIVRNIAKAGFQLKDIRYILITEPHPDHAGGAAALAKMTGAIVVASGPTSTVLRSGQASLDDPQVTTLWAMTPIETVRVVTDGEEIRLGNVAVRAMATAGHTAGSMSWLWKSCEKEECRSILFASSLNAVASSPYRFSAHPDVVAGLRQSIAKVRQAPCDILVSAHPDNSGLDQWLDRQDGPSAKVDAGLPTGTCQAYADRATQRLDALLVREKGEARSGK